MKASVAQKQCTKCKQTKPLSEFYKKWDTKDGHCTQCKKCVDKKNKNWVDENREKVRGYFRKWHNAHTEEERERIREYKRANREMVRAKAREYAADHRGEKREYDNKYYQDNKDKKTDQSREYLRRHPEKDAQYNSAKRARKAKASGKVAAKEWLELCKKYGNKCLCCGRKTNLTMDHIVPLSKGGIHHISNIQPLCGSCNSSKHTQIIDYRPF